MLFACKTDSLIPATLIAHRLDPARMDIYSLHEEQEAERASRRSVQAAICGLSDSRKHNAPALDPVVDKLLEELTW